MEGEPGECCVTEDGGRGPTSASAKRKRRMEPKREAHHFNNWTIMTNSQAQMAETAGTVAATAEEMCMRDAA